MDGNTSIWSSDNYDPVSIKLCVKKLKEEFGQQFSDNQSILEQHTHTTVSYTHLRAHETN